MLSPVSTWMGDRLGTLGAVGIIIFIDSITSYNEMTFLIGDQFEKMSFQY